jgi:hypothetical protein
MRLRILMRNLAALVRGSTISGQAPPAGSCVHKELSYSVKDEEFLRQLSEYQLLQTDSASRRDNATSNETKG